MLLQQENMVFVGTSQKYDSGPYGWLSLCLNMAEQHPTQIQDCSNAIYTTAVLQCTRAFVKETVRSISKFNSGLTVIFTHGLFFKIILLGPLKLYKQQAHNLYIWSLLTELVEIIIKNLPQRNILYKKIRSVPVFKLVFCQFTDREKNWLFTELNCWVIWKNNQLR